jgi:hypothetical protein
MEFSSPGQRHALCARHPLPVTLQRWSISTPGAEHQTSYYRTPIYLSL